MMYAFIAAMAGLAVFNTIIFALYCAYHAPFLAAFHMAVALLCTFFAGDWLGEASIERLWMRARQAARIALCAAILLVLASPSYARGGGGGHGGGHGGHSSAHGSAHGSGHASSGHFSSRSYLGRYRSYGYYGHGGSDEEACAVDGQLWGDRTCVADPVPAWFYAPFVALFVLASLIAALGS